MMKTIRENNTFIYIWFNRVKKMFYIGKHYGSINDGYICSSKMMLRDYNRNPEHFKRRILEFITEIDGKQGLAAELKWLSLIPDEELGRKYYNLKKENFGNTRGHKKAYVWNQGLSKEQQKEYQNLRKNKLFCLLSEKPTRGMLFKPLIQYDCNYCGKKFEDKNFRRFCSNSCSAKWGNENGNAKNLKKIKKGQQAWNKGIPNPKSSENGRKGAARLSATVTGRKLLVREDGSRTWVYPNKNKE